MHASRSIINSILYLSKCNENPNNNKCWIIHDSYVMFDTRCSCHIKMLRLQPVPSAFNKNRKFGSKLKIQKQIYTKHIYFVRITKKCWNADYVDGREAKYRKEFCVRHHVSMCILLVKIRSFFRCCCCCCSIWMRTNDGNGPTEHTNLFIAWMTRIQCAIGSQSAVSTSLQTHSIESISRIIYNQFSCNF